jgi:hypothetical protein
VPLEIPLQFERRFNEMDFSAISGKSWELILVYEDIFGNNFHSMHPKNPLRLSRLYRETDAGGHFAPPQPWVVLGKGKPPERSGHGLVTGFADKPPS